MTGRPRQGLRAWAPWLAMAVVVLAALAVGVFGQHTPTEAERAQHLAESIRCPSCKSQSAASSDTPSSQAVRALIADRVAAGDSDEEIRDYVASRYGREILLEPPGSGISVLVWALPVVLVVVAGVGLVVRFRDYRPGRHATPEDERLVAEALAGASGGEPGAGAAPGPGAGDGSPP